MKKTEQYNYSELIYLFIDGEASDTQKETLFSALSSNSDLQQEFQEALELNKSLSSDKTNLVPSERLRNSVFAAIGIDASSLGNNGTNTNNKPVNNAQGNNVTNNLTHLSQRMRLLSKIKTSLIAFKTPIISVLAGALATSSVYIVLNNTILNDSDKTIGVKSNQQTASILDTNSKQNKINNTNSPIPNVSSIENANERGVSVGHSYLTTKSISDVENSNEASSNNKSSRVRNTARVNNKQDNESKYAFNNVGKSLEAPESTDDNKSINTNNRDNDTHVDANAANQQSSSLVPENKDLAQNIPSKLSSSQLDYPAYQINYTEFSNRADNFIPSNAHHLNYDLIGETNKYNLYLEVKGISGLGILPKRSETVSSNTLAKGYSIVADYKLSDNDYLGFHVGNEAFQIYEINHYGDEYTLNKDNSIFYISANYRKLFKDLTNGYGLKPYTDISLGGTKFGAVAKGIIGLTYQPSGNFSFSLGFEGTTFTYQYSNNLKLTGKYSIVYGIGFGL